MYFCYTFSHLPALIFCQLPLLWYFLSLSWVDRTVPLSCYTLCCCDKPMTKRSLQRKCFILSNTFTSQSIIIRGGTTHSKLSLPTPIPNPEKATCLPVSQPDGRILWAEVLSSQRNSVSVKLTVIIISSNSGKHSFYCGLFVCLMVAQAGYCIHPGLGSHLTNKLHFNFELSKEVTFLVFMTRGPHVGLNFQISMRKQPVIPMKSRRRPHGLLLTLWQKSSFLSGACCALFPLPQISTREQHLLIGQQSIKVLCQKNLVPLT